MPMYQPVLREGETILYTHGIWKFGYETETARWGSGVKMWLTDQRVIFKSSLIGGQRTLPLYRITRVWEEEKGMSLYAFDSTRYYKLCLEFDNGCQEWMIIGNQAEQAQFVALLNATRARAPQVPDEVLPPVAYGNPHITIPAPAPQNPGIVAPVDAPSNMKATSPWKVFALIGGGCALLLLLFAIGSVVCGWIVPFILRMANHG